MRSPSAPDFQGLHKADGRDGRRKPGVYEHFNPGAYCAHKARSVRTKSRLSANCYQSDSWWRRSRFLDGRRLGTLARLVADRRFAAGRRLALTRRLVAVRRLAVVRRFDVVRLFAAVRFFGDERRFLRLAISPSYFRRHSSKENAFAKRAIEPIGSRRYLAFQVGTPSGSATFCNYSSMIS
jgi:hypothetical protein